MIDATTADALDALATQIQAATAADPNLDSQLYNLIAEPMLTIQGRVAPASFKYTLNITNALLLRAKGWYIRGLLEIDEPNAPFAGMGLEAIDANRNVTDGTNGNGATLGLAACAAIARCWAKIIRGYLAAQPA